MPIYGIIVSVIFLYFEWDVPGYLENTTFTYIRYYIFSLAVFRYCFIKIKSSVRPHASILGAVRVIVGPLIGFGLIKFLI